MELVEMGRTHDGQRCEDCDRIMFRHGDKMVCRNCGAIAERLLYGDAALACIGRVFFELSGPAPLVPPPPSYTQGGMEWV